MQIFLQLRSKVPIYEQIVAQVKQLILSGCLKDGDPIPSMRALAKTLRVSVITVQKAYEDLQREGFIDSLAGRGSFVRAPDTEGIRREYIAKIRAHAKEIGALAKTGGICTDEVIEIVRSEAHDSAGRKS
ncbi:MAG: GntR family transcriptional regulator [Defluviitaleaceae bacterium]|nr:GntR family transcriptional regulator [Defluviitaleaceae bacterium]